MPAVPIQEACPTAFPVQTPCVPGLPPTLGPSLPLHTHASSSSPVPSCLPTAASPGEAAHFSATRGGGAAAQPLPMRCGPQPWRGASIQVCPPLDTLPQPSDILQSPLPSHSHSVCHHLTLPCVNHSVLSISWLDPTDTTALIFHFYITIVILMPFVCPLVSELHEGRAHLLFQEHDKSGVGPRWQKRFCKSMTTGKMHPCAAVS